MRAEMRGADQLGELKLGLQREEREERERAQLRRELEAIAGSSTAGLAPSRPQLPRNAYAVSGDGSWTLIVARYPGVCRCGNPLHRNQRVALQLETRETRCTACVQHITFSLTRYGRRRRQGNRARKAPR